MRITAAIAGTTAASLVVGLALLIVSPVSCGCLTPLQGLVQHAGLDDYTYGGTQYSAEQIETGLNSRLVGRKITTNPPDAILLGCDSPSPTHIECRVVTDEAMVVSRGFDVRFEVKPSGMFVRAYVKRSWSWL
jgi:hypothetical protein